MCKIVPGVALFAPYGYFTQSTLILIEPNHKKGENSAPLEKQDDTESLMSSLTSRREPDDEFSLFDFFNFFVNNRLIIAGTATVGIVVATMYLMIVPSVYEATLQVEMARISSESDRGSDRDMYGTPVEDPQLLIERLRLPSTYTETVSQACNLQDAPYPSQKLAKQVRLKVMKGVGSVAEITVPGESPDAAKACASSIFEMIRNQQAALLYPFANQTQKKKALLESRLRDNSEFLEKMNGTTVQSAVYLAKRDESLWLMNQIADLERSLQKTVETRLVSPIYATPQAVSPNVFLILTFFGLGGLALGFALAFLRTQIKEWRG